jgi:hypothetical protein
MDGQMRSNNSDPDQNNLSVTKSYAPSFLDKFMDFIQRLPFPYWLTYLLLITLQGAIFHVLAWLDGWLPAYTLSMLLLLFPLWLWGPMAIMTYLNLTSQTALSKFSQLLDIDEDSLFNLKTEFTTMPNRGVIINGVVWAILYVLLIIINYDALRLFGFGNFFFALIILEGLISYSTGGAIYYHSLRQLTLVNRTVKMVRQFNLFNLDPIYALSRLTSRTGISWMLMLGLTLIMYPLEIARGATMILLAFQVVLALMAFVLPLQFVNQKLVVEKRRLLSGLNQRIESTLERLHLCIDENRLNELELIDKAIASLNTERSILKNIPTWPWSSGTLTGFLSAIGLPMILLLLQLMIQNWLAK